MFTIIIDLKFTKLCFYKHVHSEISIVTQCINHFTYLIFEAKALRSCCLTNFYYAIEYCNSSTSSVCWVSRFIPLTQIKV